MIDHFKSRAGMSVIELVVAMTIFVLLALAAGSLFGTVVKTSNKDRLTQEVQRDGDAVLAQMSRKLKDATTVVPPSLCNATNTNVLSVLVPPAQTRTYDITANQIRYTEGLNPPEILQPPNSTIQSMTFVTTCSGVELKSIQLTANLRRTKGTTNVDLTVKSTVNPRPQ
jgi:type II secretory pathway pseudopilin PulG